MLRSTGAPGLLTMLLLLAAGCGGARDGKVATAPPAPEPANDCRRLAAAPAMTPIGDAREGSTVVLASFGGRTVAFVADEDARAVVAVDVDRRAELATTPLEGAPSQLLVTRDGRLVVALRDAGKIAVLEAGASGAPDAPLARRCAVDAAAEPAALALTPDGATILASSGWGHALGGFDAVTLEKRFEVDLPREPRAVAVSDNGKTAFVSHAVGARISAVDLERGFHPVHAIWTQHLPPEDAAKEEDRQTACQGFALARSAGRLLAPQVSVDPGTLEERTNGYGSDGGEAEVPMVAVVDEATDKRVQTSVQTGWHGDHTDDAPPPCLLPRAAAVDPASRTLLVACQGIDAVVAYDALAAAPVETEIRRWTVGGGPSGIAVDAAGGRAVVFSQFDRAVHVIPLRGGDVAAEIKGDPALPRLALAPIPRSAVETQRAYGRNLFHSVADTRIARDGRACASCHPDGRDDAITWATPDGPRRTPLLAGRVEGTAPYGWSGNGSDLRDHLGHTFERLHGRGLGSVEIEAVIAYLQGLRPPPSRADDPRAARGDAIFHSHEAGCAGCHAGAALTDGQKHDVGSRAKGDRAAELDTPSLRAVGARAPYFHDGRYATLRDLLRANETMGSTKQLSEADLDALEAYLRSL